MKARYSVLSLVAVLTCPAFLVSASNDSPNVPEGSTVENAQDIQSKVTLKLYHEKDLPIGPGFSVYISGWEPGDTVEVFAYDKNRTRVDIVSGQKRLPVSKEGKVSFSLPYQFHAFRPGRWAVVVSGKSGQHAHYVDIPKSD